MLLLHPVLRHSGASWAAAALAACASASLSHCCSVLATGLTGTRWCRCSMQPRPRQPPRPPALTDHALTIVCCRHLCSGCSAAAAHGSRHLCRCCSLERAWLGTRQGTHASCIAPAYATLQLLAADASLHPAPAAAAVVIALCICVFLTSRLGWLLNSCCVFSGLRVSGLH